jgi:hypothetical protein
LGYALDIWDGIYNFDLFEAKISRKKSDMPNHKLVIKENIDIMIPKINNSEENFEEQVDERLSQMSHF